MRHTAEAIMTAFAPKISTVKVPVPSAHVIAGSPAEFAVDMAKLRSALVTLDPDCNEKTWKLARIAPLADAARNHPEHAKKLYELARQFSSGELRGNPSQQWITPGKSNGLTGEEVFDAVWARFMAGKYTGKPTGLGTIFRDAELAGWQWVGEGAAGSATDAPESTQPGDIRNGRVFAKMFIGKLLYVRPMGRWFRWDGAHWSCCVNGEELEAAKEVAMHLLKHASEVAASDADKGKRLFQHALLTQNLPRLEAMIKLASSEPRMCIGSMSELDTNPWLLGVCNGVVDLRTGSLLEPSPEMLITRQCNASFDREAECPRWLQFLDEVFNGDTETIETVQRLMGYTLTGIVTEEVMVICFGSGANGKSVAANVQFTIMGGYATVGPSSLLVIRREDDTGARNDLAKLCGARLISINELQQGDRLDELVVKQLAGREPISARFLHKEFFDFFPTGKAWLRTNHKPIITGEDDGIWRRLILIPFRRKFAEHERDPYLEERLLEERDGILMWMIGGAVKWKRDGLKLSQAITSERQSYRKESDLLGEFLEDKTETWASGREEQAAVFGAWRNWCEQSGIRYGSKAAFTRRLAERGHGEVKSNGKRYYAGLKLRPSEGVYGQGRQGGF